MNDNEKKIEDFYDGDINEKEDVTIKGKIDINREDDKKRKIIIYVIIGVVSLCLIGLLIYILIFDKKDTNVDNNFNTDNGVLGDEVDNSDEEEEVGDNLGYVSCDDNTALLNVRNSTSGDIIDGLSCYKQITILEELDGTDACDNWYRIGYDKNDSNYTGYACGSYIKKYSVSSDVISDVRNLVDKVNDYYEGSVLTAYCGNASDKKEIQFDDNMTGEYVKSEFSNLDELKNYLYSFMDEDLIDIKFTLSDIDNPKYYDNYYEIDGKLYCRNYAGKGWNSSYTGNYDVEVVSYSDDEILVNIVYQYIDENSDCNIDDLSSCSRSDFVYEIGKMTVKDNIVTKVDFHK